MSKSKGNYYTVGQLAAEGYEGREIRHALLAAHYRQALNFTREGLDRSRATLNHLTGFLRRLRGPAEGEPRPELDALIATAETDFDHALADDLNLPRAQAALFELVAAVNRLGIGPGDGIRVEGILRSFDAILGIMPPADTLDDQLPPDIQLLVDRRQAARKYQDYTTADSLRGELSRLGYSIEDGPHGPLVIRKHTDSESPPKDA